MLKPKNSDAIGMCNWIPINLKQDIDNYTCEWLHAGTDDYLEPFFDQSISKIKYSAVHQYHYRPTSSLDMLTEWEPLLHSIQPTAFIFHISRCGSTLISQSLSLDDKNIVLPEVPFIDDILRLPHAKDEAQRYESLIRSVFRYYGQNRNAIKKNLFIKTDSWHIHYLPLMRKLYPNTPFILLYRRPDEVIQSHRKKYGVHAVPGIIPNELLGIAPLAGEWGFEAHIVKVLESYLSSFLKEAQRDPFTLLINYNEGIENMMKKVFDFSKTSPDAQTWEKIRQRGQYHAKYPHEEFKEEKRSEKPACSLATVMELYEKLEMLRSSRS